LKYLMGALAALASSLTWAFTSVLLTSQAGRMRPLTMSAIRSGTASLLLVALLVASGGLGQYGDVSFVTAFSMAGSGIMGQALGDTLYISALALLGVTRSFPITNSAYPFLTFVLAVILLGEDVHWTTPLGGALIVAGITWIVIEQRRAANEAKIRVDVLRGAVFAVSAALAWSLATIWLRGQQDGLDAFGAAALRIPAASLATMLTIGLTMRRPIGAVPLRPMTRMSVAVVMAAGIIGTGIGSVLFIYAVEDLGAAKTAFLTTSAPVFALPMGVLMLNEKLTSRELIGTVATIAGIWLVLL
jgi:drug/metabolite transporter (DMT)-like permease